VSFFKKTLVSDCPFVEATDENHMILISSMVANPGVLSELQTQRGLFPR